MAGGRILPGSFGELAGACTAGLALFAALFAVSGRARSAARRIIKDIRGAFSRRA
jgi:hypothetical protein